MYEMVNWIWNVGWSSRKIFLKTDKILTRMDGGKVCSEEEYMRFVEEYV